MKCYECGTKLEDNEDKCPYCGLSKEESIKRHQKKKKDYTWLYALLLVAGIIIFIIIANIVGGGLEL